MPVFMDIMEMEVLAQLICERYLSEYDCSIAYSFLLVPNSLNDRSEKHIRK